MTIEELDAAIEDMGEQAFELIKAIVDPEEDTSRATQILNELMDVSKGYINIAGQVSVQSKGALISRIMVGGQNRAADVYFPLLDPNAPQPGPTASEE